MINRERREESGGQSRSDTTSIKLLMMIQKASIPIVHAFRRTVSAIQESRLGLGLRKGLSSGFSCVEHSGAV